MKPSRSLVARATIAAAALVVVLATASTAAAQALPIREVHISNNTEDWSVGTRPFDVTRHVSIFIVFATDRHPGFMWSGQCVVALAATHQPLHSVRVHPEWMRPGNDVIRTASFLIAWPAAPVEITCIPDANPAGAFTTIIGVEWQRRPYMGSLEPGTPGLPPTLPARRRASVPLVPSCAC